MEKMGIKERIMEPFRQLKEFIDERRRDVALGLGSVVVGAAMVIGAAGGEAVPENCKPPIPECETDNPMDDCGSTTTTEFVPPAECEPEETTTTTTTEATTSTSTSTSTSTTAPSTTTSTSAPNTTTSSTTTTSTTAPTTTVTSAPPGLPPITVTIPTPTTEAPPAVAIPEEPTETE